jgi:hypothetical protein
MGLGGKILFKYTAVEALKMLLTNHVPRDFISFSV